MYTILVAHRENFSSALQLLAKHDLPTEDIGEQTTLFIAKEGDEVIGTVGVEFYDNIALLRSLAVTDDKRSAGLGTALVHRVEEYAKEKGVKELVILTTTAADYFRRKGYVLVKREDVDESIKKSSEFTIMCPASASVMKKQFT